MTLGKVILKTSLRIAPTSIVCLLTVACSQNFYGPEHSNGPLKPDEIAFKAHQDPNDEIAFKQYILAFQQDPHVYIDLVPPKFDSAGNQIPDLLSSPITSDLPPDSVAAAKYQARKPIIDSAPKEIRGRRLSVQSIRYFFDRNELPNNRVIQSLEKMEEASLLSASLKTEPWSDHYWPLYKGVLGARYVDQDFYFGDSFLEYLKYVNQPINNFLSLFKASTSENKNRNMLSPSEKYDLLIGYDPQSTHSPTLLARGMITHKMWEQGNLYQQAYNKVETWMGICHGWAPASYMLPAPQNAISVVVEHDRSPLTLYPSDIKALGSYLWSFENTVPTSSLGGRCEKKASDLKKDPTSGAIIDEICFDVNPQTWHLAVVNQIGVAKRSFVIDATFDYEVWNQPILSYEYSYFNPKTGDRVKTFNEALAESGSWDPFRNIRKRNGATAAQIVGIVMTLKYMVETSPNHSTHQPNSYNQVTYMYDLEVEKHRAGYIPVGGEWYSNIHPDFIWNPVKNGRPISSLERNRGYLSPDDVREDRLSTFDVTKSLSENTSIQSDLDAQEKARFLKDLSVVASQNGEVSAWIIEGLFRASAQ